MEKTTILVACEGQVAYVQVNGRGSFQNAGHFKRFYTEAIEQGTANKFILDLAHCIYLDSTFLGTITGLALKLQELKSDPLEVVNVIPRLADLMHNMGLDRILTIRQEGLNYKPGETSEVEQSPESKRETGETMLEAHLNLVTIDSRNEAKFKDVIDYLREDLGQEEVN